MGQVPTTWAGVRGGAVMRIFDCRRTIPFFVFSAVLWLTTAPAHAAPKALILGSTVIGSPSVEEQQAQADGFDVTVVSDATWGAMTATDFAQYQVLIIGDPACGDTVDGAAGANASVWQPVVMGSGGNRVIIGTDPVFHGHYGLITQGIAFAGAIAGATGAYIDISCESSFTATMPFSFLDGLTTHPPGGFTTEYPPCQGDISIVAQSGPTSGLHDSDLSGWECSVHQSFITWPSDFTPLAIATDASIKPYCANDVDTGMLACGEPYVLVSGGGIVITSSISLAPAMATNPICATETLTATVTQSDSTPLVGTTVTFTVESGPNVGQTGTGVTDSNGQTAFSYTNSGGAGTDLISASFVNGFGATEKATATNAWFTCDDGNECTDDSCDPVTGCSSVPVPGQACDDGNACTLGDQCDANGACIPGGPAPANTACDDGVFCDGSDTCDDAGSCANHSGDPCAEGSECDNVCNETAHNCEVTAASPCTDDGNPCTDDVCDGAGHCGVDNNAPCDDGMFCNGADTCAGGTCSIHVGDPCAGGPQCDNVCNEAAGNCAAPAETACDDTVFCNGGDTCDGEGSCSVHAGSPCPETQCNTCQEATQTCFDPAGSTCDDGNSGTFNDRCNGAGSCSGLTETSTYAILRWPAPPAGPVRATLGRGASVNGSVCADSIKFRAAAKVDGDAVGLETMGAALTFTQGDHVQGNAVTGGGSISGLSGVTVGGHSDTTGTAVALSSCDAAGAQASARQAAVAALTPDLSVGTIAVSQGGSVSIPSSGALGAGVVVVDTPGLKVNKGGTLKLIGSPQTSQVIVRVAGGMSVRRQATVALEGLSPEQVLFVVNGRLAVKQLSKVSGTLFGAGTIYLGLDSIINGQIVAEGDVNVRSGVTVNLHPFAGW